MLLVSVCVLCMYVLLIYIVFNLCMCCGCVALAFVVGFCLRVMVVLLLFVHCVHYVSAFVVMIAIDLLLVYC